MGLDWTEDDGERAHRLDEEHLEELLDIVRSEQQQQHVEPMQTDSQTATIVALQQRLAELEPLGERLADTEQRRMDLEVQMRVLQEERDALAAERVERAALKRRNERLENELARVKEMSETAMRELSETRMHAQTDQASSKDWSREALRLRKKLDDTEVALVEARRRLKTAGDALSGAVDGSRPVRRGDLVRLAQLMAVDSGDGDAMVDEVRKLFPR